MLPYEQIKDNEAVEGDTPTIQEVEEIAETSYQMFRDILLDVNEIMEKNPLYLKEEYGIDFSIIEDYYIDSEGYIRKTDSTYYIEIENEAIVEEFGIPVLELVIHSKATTWDINQPITVDFPAVEETVSFFSLMEDPDQSEALGDGLLGELFDSFAMPMPPAGKHIFMDLENEMFMLNGEPLEMQIDPYTKDGVIMLPLRQMVELAEGEVIWNAKPPSLLHTRRK